MIRCVAMLTHNDVTVPHALEIFEANKHAKAEYWGFKDVGITLEDADKLIEAMHAAGKKVSIEPLTLDEEEANKWADLAVKHNIEAYLGYFYPTVCDKLKKAGILYFPPFGRRNKDMKLIGTMDELTGIAMDIIKAGSSGIRMSVYRWIDGDPDALANYLKEKFESIGIPYMMTGSVNDFSKLDTIKEMQPWGITVGGALFEDDKFGGGSVADRIDRIDAYCNG